MSDDLVKRLRNWTTDWNGAKMVPGEPPRDGLHCDIIDEAAARIEARSMFESGASRRDIAARFRVDKSTISRLLSGSTWTNRKWPMATKAASR